MGFINYKTHLKVALNLNEKQTNRMWALRSLFYSIVSLVRVIQIDELIEIISKEKKCNIVKNGNKIIIESKIDEVAIFLTHIRNDFIKIKNDYDKERKHLKIMNRRFPVLKPFDKNKILKVIENKIREESRGEEAEYNT